MVWTDYFDAILLINLAEQPIRLQSATEELNKYKIPFIVWDASTSNTNTGVAGLNMTMMKLFNCFSSKKKILVFEDDVKFEQDPNVFMPAIVDQLEKRGDWDLLYLGVNMDNPENKFKEFSDENLLIADGNRCFATHAVAYSGLIMKAMFTELSRAAIPFQLPFDIMLNHLVTLLGLQSRRYFTYPMLATQSEGWSTIEKKYLTYEYMRFRFDQSVEHLLDVYGKPQKIKK